MSAEILSLSGYHSDDDLILIPEGEYQLSYQYHETWVWMGKAPKLSITFRIFDMGEHNNKPILAHYNLSKIIGKPRKNGHFSAGWRSNLMWEYVQCFGKPPRKDRISMCPFKEHLVIGKIRTVTKNHKQKKYHEALRYSVIDELLGKVEV